MQPGTEKDRSPVLATCLGCLAMSVIPLAAMAALVGAVYMYLETSTTSAEDQARQETLEAERQRQAAKAGPLTAPEQKRLTAELGRLGSTDPVLRRNAENIISGYSASKPRAVLAALEQTLRQSQNAQQVSAVAAYLCAYHRDEGLAVVIRRLKARRDDVLFLRAVREGVMSVQNLTLRERALKDIVSTLEREGSIHARDFFEL